VGTIFFFFKFFSFKSCHDAKKGEQGVFIWGKGRFILLLVQFCYYIMSACHDEYIAIAIDIDITTAVGIFLIFFHGRFGMHMDFDMGYGTGKEIKCHLGVYKVLSTRLGVGIYLSS